MGTEIQRSEDEGCYHQDVNGRLLCSDTGKVKLNPSLQKILRLAEGGTWAAAGAVKCDRGNDRMCIDSRAFKKEETPISRVSPS